MVELEAHRNVLSLRVPALYELILTTTATKDDEDSNIVLPTMDPTLFVILLDYIYTNKFPSQKIQGESLANSIFTVANQFGSNLLIPYNAARWLLFVDLHLCALLKEACVVKEASKENWRQLIDFTAGFAIHDFAKLPQKMDEWITTTTTVEVKGHPFKLRIYPHGNQQSKTDAEYVSIYLIYAGENTETNPVNVRYQIRTKATKYLFSGENQFSSKTNSSGWTNFKKREDIIRDDLDTNGTLTIEVDITIGIPQRQFEETTNDEPDFSSNVPIMIDSGSFYNLVPLAYHLNNERSTTNGVRIRSVSNDIIVAQATGELPLNLPKEALTAHKMETDMALLSIREAVNHGCVAVFGYGENNDAIICDENDIEIIVTGPPLVTGKAESGRLWYVSDHAKPARLVGLPSVDSLPGQQQPSPPKSSSSSMLDILPQGVCFNIYKMLSNENKIMIFVVVVVIVLVARTGAVSVSVSVKACQNLDTIF